MKKLIVMDNFYQNPELVRELALNSVYEDVHHLNYPGSQSEWSFFDETIVARFSALIGEKLSDNIDELTFGKFRFMTKNSGSRIKVHVDGQADWTGIVYLNPSGQCEGGTAFYMHKETGLEGPPSWDQLKTMGFDDYREFEEHVVARDSLDMSKWEQSFYVGMEFNRLVLFKGNELFHCHTHGFGTSFSDARLTQNFFFNSTIRPSTNTKSPKDSHATS